MLLCAGLGGMDWEAAGFELGWLDADGDLHKLRSSDDWNEALAIGQAEGRPVLRLRLAV